VAEYRLGIRANTPEVAAALREVLTAHVIDDPVAPVNYSLRIYPRGERGPIALHLLFDDCVQHRVRRAETLLEMLIWHLDARGREGDATTLQVEGVALFRDGQATIVPPGLRLQPAFHRRFARLGYACADGAVTDLDVSTGEVIVREPMLTVDREAHRRWCDRFDGGPTDRFRVPPGRYPLCAWYFTDPVGGTAIRSRARALWRAVPLVRNGYLLEGQQLLDGLAVAMENTTACLIAPSQADLPDYISRHTTPAHSA
jgi:hypothetical protein